MTAVLATETESQSALGESASWDNLPPAEPVTLPEAPQDKPDATGDAAKPAPGICAACGDPIVREPGARGRMPKYHPDCKPTRVASQVSTGVTRGRGAAKAEAEATECVAAFQSLVTKSAVMLSVVDRYDAFCVMVALPQISENLRGVLVRYDKLRKEMLAMQTGGSIFGLGLAVLMMALPMCAHHGILGKGQTAKLLLEMPFTLLRIQERLKEGSAALTKMMEEQLRAAAEANRRQQEETRAAKAAQNGSA